MLIRILIEWIEVLPGVFAYYENVLGLDLDTIKYVNEDVVKLTLEDAKYQLVYGEAVIERKLRGDRFAYMIVGGRFHGQVGTTKKKAQLRDTPILKISMIDVQQGDGLVIETPDGHLITIDAGDNVLFARHLAARFSGTSKDNPLEIDAMIVTHGDADHFSGLVEVQKSEEETDPDRFRKRLFLHPAHVFHNGLVKGKSSLADKDRFGETVETDDGDVFITALEEDLLAVPDTRMNGDFQKWKAALVHWNNRRTALGLSGIKFHRVDHLSTAFAELGIEDLNFDVCGPVSKEVDGTSALQCLHKPSSIPALHLSDDAAAGRSISASHTINGHSIAFKMSFEKVRLLFTGDWNQQAMSDIQDAIPDFDFQAEVLKAPHHGSEDFDMGVLRAANPVVSLVSSGDENAFHEHIHPRASLVSALGKVSRGENGIVLMTELAAFFKYRGMVRDLSLSAGQEEVFFGFERTNFGIIHIRTDGARLLALTHSGKKGLNEVYRYRIEDDGTATSQKPKTVS